MAPSGGLVSVCDEQKVKEKFAPEETAGRTRLVGRKPVARFLGCFSGPARVDMSSDEDFSLVTDDGVEQETEEGLRKLIQSYKERHTQLLAEQKQLAADRDQQRKLSQDFNQRSEKLTQRLKTDKEDFQRQLSHEKVQLSQLQEEQAALTLAIQEATAALAEEECASSLLKQQASVFQAAPQREVVFHGRTSDVTPGKVFSMKAKILYPMEGGTALVTFEEAAAASKVVEMRRHTVSLGEDCRMTVEAGPLHLLLPRRVQIHTEVSRKKILISDLPDMDPEILLDKLQIHFAKKRHGGGEVEECELLGDSGTVVVTFVDDNVSAGLTETEFHDIQLQQKRTHRVRVTPFLHGRPSDLQNKLMPCPRTVLLTGIPDVMDQETLQDLLEIHFQKSGNGGGEIEAILYNPLGHQAMAQFESVKEE
ncbi:interferon-induced protein 35 [Synchiropus splendidus]|uniref:interferon-induced protein 35 n=1 Tax=Synchiropus splendidus TaxID=270530 RepID=UPI00237EA03A|nr:interferon-induced protein 35 [Synchiropus splendidus]